MRNKTFLAKNAHLRAFLLFILFFSTLSFAVAPSVETSRTDPTGTQYYTDVSTIEGFCNASDGDTASIIYPFRWFKDDGLYSSGTLGNFAGTQQNATPDAFYSDIPVSPSYAEDNDYGTAASSTAKDVYYYAYYNYSGSIPSGLTGATWQVKHGTLATYNITLSSSCYSADPIQLRMWVWRAAGAGKDYRSRPQCYYSSTWNDLGTESAPGDNANGATVYEQDIFFTQSATTFTQNVETSVSNITTGGSGDYVGEWILECKAYDNTDYSAALNSSTLTIIDNPDVSACKNLSTPNSVYSLTQDISSTGTTCINITAENVTLNCSGYKITGDNTTSTAGVNTSKYNTSVKNCIILNFSTGIYIDGDGADYANITNNTINITYETSCSSSNGKCNAIFLTGADNSEVKKNRVYVYQYGIGLNSNTNYNNVSYNNASASYNNAIYIYTSSNNTISYNNASASTNYAMSLSGSFNNTVSFNNVSASSYAISLSSSSSNNNITYNNASASVSYTIYLSASSNNTISYNNASASTSFAIYFASNCNNNNITYNNASAPSSVISISTSSNNTISYNNASSSSGYAIVLSTSSNNNTVS
ncbi:MAG: right-handed parallel beta-helix repeat-containing protein, partial [Candidatus Micrarchaeota archaeon]